MPSETLILPCRDPSSIVITPTAEPSHPLQHPAFSVPSSISAHLETASHHLHSSRTVAFPTETVYGLGASTLDAEAVKKIYAIKNRPVDNPLITHISSLDMLQRLLPPQEEYKLSRVYMALVSAFWPGPLTLLFPSPDPPAPPAPQTNAIRMPAHPVALALINHADLPLSAPSANSSGRPSPTQAHHVYNDLKGSKGLGCILDGGDCGVGVESTVVDALGWKEGGGGSVNILRPGGLGVEDIARVVIEVDGAEDATQILVHGSPWQWNAEASSSKRPATALGSDAPPPTPGMKYKHYSPRIPVFLLLPSTTFPRPSASIQTGQDATPQAVLRRISTSIQRNGKRPRFGLLHYENSPLSRHMVADSDNDVQFVSLGPTAESAAQRLFSSMLEMEGSMLASCLISPSEGVDAIMIEGCSSEGLGLAVMERIGKAASGAVLHENVVDDNGEINKDDGTYWVNLS